MLRVRQIATPSFALLSYIIIDSESGECFVIDPPADFNAHADIASLKIKAVINTHIHPDHTMGNHLFSGKVPILAHTDEGSLFQRIMNSSLAAVFTARIPPKISFTLIEGSDLRLGDIPVEVLHTPGHSPGSICLFWPGNLLSGDTIFIEGIGRTDIPGGSFREIRASIERLIALPGETKVWPGHSYGGRYSANLREIVPLLRQMIRSPDKNLLHNSKRVLKYFCIAPA
ncbi:MAG TPA: MBL fold metallo-hydrolase [Deltaproteobacteria bacterium]|nr:MBL fold metallo-hydrolase [Deltaproteobacteria bacterium]HQI02263.1 MBL fold metallo-hydrolase [Deltaproteobacteria bacterium]HQJ07407.1 MBL fold metallo-hydrolase [Deltaproteobacteria bacterium]